MCIYDQYLFSHIKLNKVEYTEINFNVFLFRIINNKTAMSSAQRQGHKLFKYITNVKLHLHIIYIFFKTCIVQIGSNLCNY